ncbi:lipopolysaccharide biosynthesis protein [Epibacterium ulvae]|uniref:GumC family protein n=1 Tax=Epibacterium ulvae TaxID=1156985 RepID=UPI001BFC4A05|nr:Wzz/FepE/Etk N-terminal domain-containing protein [Epibacterium ulvae]MBT8154560.1 lipopolysaccharide biosynthesis protein [Epibacterium ulvae]
METLWYYLSIFRRRFHYFLIVATVMAAASVIAALSLPPAYESRAVLLVESPQIPEELAASTVRSSALEQLQVVQQRLLTRDNMLAIARKLDVFEDIDQMNPDAIVTAMHGRTTIAIAGGRRNEAPVMTLSFEAAAAQTTAEVLNEYLVLIQTQDAEFRQGRSGETLNFFVREVERLNQELDLQGQTILAYKQANSEILPDSLQFRLRQQSVFQDRLIQIDREVAELQSQRTRLLQLYELTGGVNNSAVTENRALSPQERRLETAQAELAEALTVFSRENPRVKVLEARVAQLEADVTAVLALAPAPETEDANAAAAEQAQLPAVLVVQLSEVDSRIEALDLQRIQTQERLDALNQGIDSTPEVTIALEDMSRKYASLQNQYEQAEARLSKAQTGDQIETRSRGQRIVVIEQPSIPSQPTKPNRTLIAGGGTFFGILVGIALVVMLELLNNSPRRPEDIVTKLGITPLTTIPYMQSRGQRIRNRSWRGMLALIIILGVPAAVYAVHLYYLPLDLIADKIMTKLGVRW